MVGNSCGIIGLGRPPAHAGGMCGIGGRSEAGLGVDARRVPRRAPPLSGLSRPASRPPLRTSSLAPGGLPGVCEGSSDLESCRLMGEAPRREWDGEGCLPCASLHSVEDDQGAGRPGSSSEAANHPRPAAATTSGAPAGGSPPRWSASSSPPRRDSLGSSPSRRRDARRRRGCPIRTTGVAAVRPEVGAHLLQGEPAPPPAPTLQRDAGRCRRSRPPAILVSGRRSRAGFAGLPASAMWLRVDGESIPGRRRGGRGWTGTISQGSWRLGDVGRPSARRPLEEGVEVLESPGSRRASRGSVIVSSEGRRSHHGGHSAAATNAEKEEFTTDCLRRSGGREPGIRDSRFQIRGTELRPLSDPSP